MSGVREPLEAKGLGRTGGYPDPIQREDPKLEAHLKSLDLYGYYLSPAKQHEAEEMSSGAKDWELPLQLASEKKAGMMWDFEEALLRLRLDCDADQLTPKNVDTSVDAAR